MPSLAGSADLINALLGVDAGNHQAKLWRCTDSSSASLCLAVSLQAVSIPEKSTLTYRVRKIIQSLHDKLKTDQIPNAEEKNFLSMTGLPVLKFLSVLSSTEYGDVSVDMEEYASLIAQDLLQNYLSELLQEVSNATAGSELNEDLVKDIQTRIHEANRKLSSLDPKVGRKLQEKLALISRVSQIEKQVALSAGN